VKNLTRVLVITAVIGLAVLLAACEGLGQSATPTPIVAPTATLDPNAAPAEQVVRDFLNSLQSDPSGKSSTQFLDATQMAQIAKGRTVAGLIGMQNIYESYNITTLDTDNPDSVSLRATLRFQSGPLDRIFVVNNEGGKWLIHLIIPLGGVQQQP
jgi:hypothetical protein